MPWGEIMAKNRNKTHKENINQYVSEYRQKYTNNKKVIDGLYIMLDETKRGIQTTYSEETLISIIERKKKEQEYIIKYLRKNMNTKYKNALLKRYTEKQKQEQITKDLKRNVNNKYRKRTVAKYKGINQINDSKPNELVKSSRLGDYIKNPIYKDKEIIIETNIVNKYVADVIETRPEQKTTKKPVTTILDSIRTRKNKIKEFPGAKVVFDGIYKIIYEGNEIFSEPIDDVLLEYNYSTKNAKNNINIIRMLERFDEKNRSNLCNKYRNGELKVYYDLLQYSRLQENSFVTKQMTKIAKQDAKHNKSVTIYKENKINKFKTGLTAVAAAALVAIGSLWGASKLNKNKYTNNKNVASVEATTENDIESVTELSYAKVENVTETEVESATEVKKTETTEAKKVEVKQEIKQDAKPQQKIETTKQEVKIQPKIEEKELKFGDTIQLDNVDLYYTSLDEQPTGNTQYLDGYCTPVLAAVIYNDQVIDEIDGNSVSLTELEKSCKEKYGDSVKISVNFNYYDKDGNMETEYLGWVDLDEVQAKSKVLTR